LGINDGLQDFDRVVFVGADATLKNLFLAALGVEVPTARAVLDDGIGRGQFSAPIYKVVV
jgi:hypothetical protein